MVVAPVEPAGAGSEEAGAVVLGAVLGAEYTLLPLEVESGEDGVVMLGVESEPPLALPEEAAGAASEPVEDEGDEEGVVASCEVCGAEGVVMLESLDDCDDGLAVSPAKAAVEMSAVNATAIGRSFILVSFPRG